jgi:hypothetical protein
MKAQFKYNLMTGMSARGSVFLGLMLINMVFITLGSAGLLPQAAHIVGVSLCGVGLLLMMCVNLLCDIGIIRRMFSAPEAYTYALAPVHRGKMLFAGLATITLADMFTMGALVVAQVWLALNLAGRGIWQFMWTTAFDGINAVELLFIVCLPLLVFAGYTLFVTVVVFCVALKNSLLYKMPAGWILAVFAGFGVFWVFSLADLVMIPFGGVQMHGMLINITVVGAGYPIYVALTFLKAAAVFVLTAKLMERRVNI